MSPSRLLTLVFLVILALGGSVARSQQQAAMPATNPAPPSTRPASLPDGWIGTWQGDVQVVVPGDQVTGAFTMTLEITPAADQPAGGLPVYTWSITYQQGDQQQRRDYLLRLATDAAGAVVPGHFVLDQKNGILVDQFLVGRMMQGHFIVNSGGLLQILHARYELVADEAGNPAMEMEIATYDGNESRRSTVEQGGVESRRLVRVQKGVLERK
jgi:hypothetical protein